MTLSDTAFDIQHDHYFSIYLMYASLSPPLPPSIRRPEQLLPDKVFFDLEDGASPGLDEIEDEGEKDEERRQYVRQRSNSESVLRTGTDELRRGHEQLCIRRTEAVKQRGISLLNEVDAQYSALQVVYS